MPVPLVFAAVFLQVGIAQTLSDTFGSKMFRKPS